MEKDTTICFRTDHDLGKSLRKTAREDRRSLSSLIEMMLRGALKARKRLPQKERRQFPRRSCDLAALIGTPQFPETHSGMIHDLSLSGLNLSLSREAYDEMRHGQQEVVLSVIFALLDDKSMVTVKCAPEWTNHVNGTVDLGCSFADCSHQDCRKLQKYLA